MTPPADSLEAALRAVPLRCEDCGVTEAEYRLMCKDNPFHTFKPNYPALAAAVREWIRKRMPLTFLIAPFESTEQQARGSGYNAALADVALGLGL